MTTCRCLKTVVALIVVLIAATGCTMLGLDKKAPPAGAKPGYHEGMYDVFDDLEGAAKDMSRGILTNLKANFYRTDTSTISPILITTFADLNDLSQTSALGRLFSEMVMTVLHAENFEIIEMRKGNAIDIVKNDGEFMLTRDLKDLVKKHDAKSVIVGTYTVTEKSVVFNGRLIGISDSKLYSAWTTRLVRTQEVDSLVRQKNLSGSSNHDSGYGRNSKKKKQQPAKETDNEPVTVYERVPAN
ncbi:MAG: FlgO family outer membrane protein [Nitrospirae bacterium YQR-1]